ncbi:MAG: ferric reductase-like transmembrane domain-containing protein, partial [Thermoleophilia bacterium]|nr:ferric reductase-like transmembrane domain-containing protein [Thermoleophilia bacterium]
MTNETTTRSWVPRHDLVRLATHLFGIGLALTIVLGVASESSASLGTAGGIANAVGRVTSLIGTYGLLVMVVLVARLQFLERVVGQDVLTRWHRWVAPYVLVLLWVHTVGSTLGYARAEGDGVLHEFWKLLTTTPGMLTGTVGLVLLTVAALSSYHWAKRHMKYETWWAVHLYTYLGIGLSFSHQLSSGSAFVEEPVARAFWVGLWLATVGVVAWFRLFLPIFRSSFHALTVESIRTEHADVVSIALRGRRLDLLPIRGGQFLQWRFLRRGMWAQAHPYSISAMPTRSSMRVTVKRLGDHSDELFGLEPGTRVFIEGPYGTFTHHRMRTNRVLLIGAGVGVTPIRALLEDLPAGCDVLVALRAASTDDLVLAEGVVGYTE